jgi:hypothetical protein
MKFLRQGFGFPCCHGAAGIAMIALGDVIEDAASAAVLLRAMGVEADTSFLIQLLMRCIAKKTYILAM